MYRAEMSKTIYYTAVMVSGFGKHRKQYSYTGEERCHGSYDTLVRLEKIAEEKFLDTLKGTDARRKWCLESISIRAGVWDPLELPQSDEYGNYIDYNIRSQQFQDYYDNCDYAGGG